jgi:glycosyltransferase involved in cell wall biosynthesis/tRNA A-37 threonylcarbamoyl transferase component Bud32
MKLEINPAYANLTDFVTSVPERFERNEGTVIYKGRNEIRVFEVDGEKINVKRYHKPFIINRIIYTFFRPSKARRAFVYARSLLAKGINTPEPIACIIINKTGLISDSYFISKHVDCERNMYEFGSGGIEGREHIIAALAVFTAKMHEQGILHRDYSPGNILFGIDNGEAEFCVVDINRMRFGKVSVSAGCRNFARLWGQKPFFELLASKYAEARGADSAYCVRTVLKARERFWRRYAMKRPLPFAFDEAACDAHNLSVSVILSTYNQPDYLEKVLWGYEAQTDRRFEVIIADDGSDRNTRDRIEALRPQLSFPIKHVWQPDDGFRKCAILNKAIVEAAADYLLFSDGDCVPRHDFVAIHLKYREKRRFLSGGYFKLDGVISAALTKEDILAGICHSVKWLKSKGLMDSIKNNKLTSFGWKEWFLNIITTTRATWNGHNASGWRSDIIAANGFDERMRYGGEDREFGERLVNAGIRGKQIRYSAICLHLEHSRSYISDADLALNKQIRQETKQNHSVSTNYGIVGSGL